MDTFHRGGQPQQYYDDYTHPMTGMPMQPPKPSAETIDQIDSYGAIIKDLTEAEKLLDKFELSLKNKIRNPDGKLVDKYADYKARITDQRVIQEFVDYVRSYANQNTHFSKYEYDQVSRILNMANYDLTKYMMLQGEKVPMSIRKKIIAEAMAIICASLHKANEGTTLRWSKGTFSDQSQAGIGGGGGMGKGILNKINPFNYVGGRK
jgi:hypothetical protein